MARPGKRSRSDDGSGENSVAVNTDSAEHSVTLAVLSRMPQLSAYRPDKRGRRGAVCIPADSDAWVDAVADVWGSGAIGGIDTGTGVSGEVGAEGPILGGETCRAPSPSPSAWAPTPSLLAVSALGGTTMGERSVLGTEEWGGAAVMQAQIEEEEGGETVAIAAVTGAQEDGQ